MAKLQEALKDLPALGPFSDEDVLRRLDDGLVLRRGTASDVEALSRELAGHGERGIANAVPGNGRGSERTGSECGRQFGSASAGVHGE